MGAGITFAVDDVKPATERLQEHDGLLEARVAAPVLIAPDRFRGVIADDPPVTVTGLPHGDLHPLVAALHKAYSDHRPFVLTPDAVALALAQGLAVHVRENAEAMRERFVRHAGRQTLVIEVENPESLADWEAAFDAVAEKLSTALGRGRVNMFTRPLSTTGPLERVATQVALMDAFSRYFDHELVFGCGIPAITLTGTEGDWQDIRARVDALAEWDLGWWAEALRPLCDQWVATAGGEVDLRFWQTIYKSRVLYLNQAASGWIIRLFPYLPAGDGHERNPFERPRGRDGDNPWLHEPVYLSSFPTGLSRVQARASYGDAEELVDLVAGFIGVGQAEEGLALSPQIGWAVCWAEHARVFDALESRHITEPAREEDAGNLMLPGCPAFLCELHARYASIDMWSGALRLRPRSESEEIRLREEIAIVRFADLADGSTLAYTWLDGVPPPHPLRWLIVHVPPGGAVEASTLTVVARSPLELFQKLLDGDEPYFLAPGAELHGDLATALETFPPRPPEPPESSSLS